MKKKVSVILEEGVHQKLKIASVQRGTTIQKAMESAAESWITSAESVEDSRGSVLRGETPAAVTLTKRGIQQYQEKLKRVLESGNALAIQGCIANLEAMEALLEKESMVSEEGGGKR